MTDPSDKKKDNVSVEHILKGVPRNDRAPPGSVGTVPIAPPREPKLAQPLPPSLTLGGGSAPKKEFVPLQRPFKKTVEDKPKPDDGQKVFKSLHERFNHAAGPKPPKH